MTRIPSTDAGRLCLAAACLLTLSIAGLSAADSTWNPSLASGNWVDDGNWSANAPGATSGTTSPDIASFLNFVSTEVTVDPYRNIGSIVMDSDPGITVTLSSGELHLTALGTISRTAAGDATSGGIVNSDIVLEGNYTFSNTSSASFLQFGTTGAPSISGAATTGTFILTLGGTSSSASNIVASSINDGVGGGNVGITKSGGGTWRITNTNTYTGTTNITSGGGILRVSATNALGTGAFTHSSIQGNTGVLQLDGGAALGGGITLGNSSLTTSNYRTQSAHLVNLSGDNVITGVINSQGTQAGPERRTLWVRSEGGSLELAGGITSTGSSGSGRWAFLDSSGGSIDVTGTITPGNRGIAIAKVGEGTATLSNANTYAGGTNVYEGTLLINNLLGSGTGTAAVTVNTGGTLGGEGSVGGAATFASGSFLSPGGEAGLTGDLDFDATLDISGLASGTGGLLYELDGMLTSDLVNVNTGALVIGEGLLDLDDFDFTLLDEFGTGTYTLFDTNEAISGTLGLNLAGTLGGYSVELALADGGNDIVLNVIPEPGTAAMLLAGLGLLALRRRGHGGKVRA